MHESQLRKQYQSFQGTELLFQVLFNTKELAINEIYQYKRRQYDANFISSVPVAKVPVHQYLLQKSSLFTRKIAEQL